MAYIATNTDPYLTATLGAVKSGFIAFVIVNKKVESNSMYAVDVLRRRQFRGGGGGGGEGLLAG